jgi:hypothetical protein
MLMREYQMDTWNWGITDINKFYNFPQYIITNSATWPMLMQLLQMYRYYRTDIEIRIKMETTPFHQGSLLISHMPGGVAGSVPITTMSGLNAYVLCASKQDECKFTIPYLCPRPWMDLTENPFQGPDSSIGTLMIRTLNTLIPTQANMPSSVPVMIYFRFVNMKQMSPVSGITPQPLKRLTAEAHMSTHHNKEAAKKHSSGVDSSSIVSSVSSLIKEVPVIGGIYSTAVGVLKSLAPDLAKPTDQSALNQQINLFGGQTATTQGLEYAVELSMYPNAQVAQNTEFYGMQSSHMGVSSLAQRPMLHNAVTLSNVSPTYQTLATPLFSQTFGNTTITLGPLATTDWLYNVTRAFAYWRGSIKYLLHFCVPSFYAFRVQISIQDQNGVPVTQVGDIINKIVDIKGDTVVTLNVPYVRNLCWSSPYQDIAEASSYLPPIIVVQIITPIVGSSAPTTPLVYLNVWRSGGEDTSFARLVGARDGSELTAEAHMNMNEMFKKPFDTLLPGQTQSTEQKENMADIAGSVSDCLKRQSQHVTGVGPFNTVFATFPSWFNIGIFNANFLTIGREPLHYFANMFMFWRGSRILKHYSSGTLVGLQGIDTTSLWGDGCSLWFPGGSQPLIHNEQYQVPYHSVLPYFPTRNSFFLLPSTFYTNSTLNLAASGYAPSDLRSTSVPTTTAGLTLQGGDDIMCLYPAPFFPLVYYPGSQDEQASSSSQGTKPNVMAPPVPKDRLPRTRAPKT